MQVFLWAASLNQTFLASRHQRPTFSQRCHTSGVTCHEGHGCNAVIVMNGAGGLWVGWWLWWLWWLDRPVQQQAINPSHLSQSPSQGRWFPPHQIPNNYTLNPNFDLLVTWPIHGIHTFIRPSLKTENAWSDGFWVELKTQKWKL